MNQSEQLETSFEPLTPPSFLRRAAVVHGSRLAAVDGDLTCTYAELWDRSRALAGVLTEGGYGDGSRIAVLGSNSIVSLLAHYGAPLAGAVLVPLNARLTAAELALIVEHARAQALLCDQQLLELGTAVAKRCTVPPVVLGEQQVERLSAGAELVERPISDERQLLSVNYTSGTTGRPKGVMYHHRGAYLQALAMAFHLGLRAGDVFLWVVPMFHCHGWCLTWGVTAAGATHICERKVDAGELWRRIEDHRVTHLAAAPTVLSGLANHPRARRIDPGRRLNAVTGGAPPSPTLLSELSDLGIVVTHAYGMTETFGPVMLCDWNPAWDTLPFAEQAERKARQGVNNVIAERPRVVDADGGEVPWDGEAMGELWLRGNDVMLGYLDDPEATNEALCDGWLRTGDLGVVHPEGFVELRDRSKDLIISGGENITSVEIERAIASHPAVLEVAVVAVRDEKWGERPAAFVTLREGAAATEEGIVAHVQERLARFKAPRDVYFVAALPKTATGKIRKHELREGAIDAPGRTADQLPM